MCQIKTVAYGVVTVKKVEGRSSQTAAGRECQTEVPKDQLKDGEGSHITSFSDGQRGFISCNPVPHTGIPN